MIVVEGGQVVDPAQGIEQELDVLVDDGKIVDLVNPGSVKRAKDKQIVDARGCLVIPGLIDAHVHLREPGFEWKETVSSGLRAAVAGGFTTVMCMPNTRPCNDSAEITKFILEQAVAAEAAAVLPIGAVSVELLGKELAPMSELHAAGCKAFSDDGEPVYNSGLMFRALEWCRMLGARICCHEEDKCLSSGGSMNESALSHSMGLKGWPKVAEEVMIARDIELARAARGKIHICHVTTARGVELIRRAKNDHIDVTAEVTPHHLLLTESRVNRYDTMAKMSPPLREEEDCQALLEGLQDGTIDIIASDHAPHERDSKLVEFDKATMGIIGLQTSLPLLLRMSDSRRIGLSRLIDALSAGTARVFGLLSRGSLVRGNRADIAVIDQKKTWQLSDKTNLSLSSNSPWWQESLKGCARHVLVAGRLVLEDGVGAWEQKQ